MKHFKRFFSYLVALTMVLSLAAFTGVKVHATEPTYKLTLKETAKGHTYEAYQVFKGDLSGDTLSNIQWGTGIDSTKKDDLIQALKDDATLNTEFGSVTDAASVAKALEGVASNSAEMDAFAQVVGQYLSTTSTSKSSAVNDNKTEITGLAAGYYLVKDKDGSQDGKPDAYTKFIVQVVGNVEAAIKSGVPTVEKKVKDTNDSTGETSDWQDSADADINDDVQYQITGTMPANIKDYTTYKYEFTDTMSKGLTYDGTAATEAKEAKRGNAKIKIGKTDSDGSFKADKDVTTLFDENVTTKDDGSTVVTWSCNNLRAVEDEKVKLDENTKVVVTYSAKLNDKAEIGSAGNPNTVYLKYSNNPNYTGKGENRPEGKTPEDKNIVFTYKLNVNKYKDEAKKEYKTTEAKFKLYKVMKDAPVKDIGITVNSDTYSAKGLDDGIYILQETEAPAGYNKMDGSVTVGSTTYENAIKFEISATHEDKSDNPKLLSLSGTAKTGEATFTAGGTKTTAEDGSETQIYDGTLTTNVVDNKGSTLPSTGGMGTTLLYVAGGILVACAAAYVVMSRKHSTNK